MSLTLEAVNTKGEKTGAVDLPEGVFGAKASRAVVHEVVNAYLANQRRGTHSTKTRGEVSGGGLKPWKQKHTGRARAGSTRSPLWRHGGIIFGPKPRSYYQDIPEAKKKLVLKAVLSDCLKEGRLSVVDALSVSEPKTRLVAEIAEKLGWAEKTVVVMEGVDKNLTRAVRNLPNVHLCVAKDLNSYDALWARRLVFTRGALEQISKRLGSH
jgi:large subunit ribosomal protein L4